MSLDSFPIFPYSNSRYVGIHVLLCAIIVHQDDGQFVLAGNILVRQRGTHIHPGVNVGIGSDDTLYAKESGVLRFERLGKDRKQASVYPAE